MKTRWFFYLVRNVFLGIWDLEFDSIAVRLNDENPEERKLCNERVIAWEKTGRRVEIQFDES